MSDLFSLDAEWSRRFGLVVEVATIQSLSPDVRRRTIEAIAGLVGPGGTVLVSAVGRLSGDHATGPPWPVKRAELLWFVDMGLREVAFVSDPSPWEGFAHFHVEYERS